MVHLPKHVKLFYVRLLTDSVPPRETKTPCLQVCIHSKIFLGKFASNYLKRPHFYLYNIILRLHINI